ncbi:protein OCTOPUS-like [Rutidosis leptorrhynchoides]|uniref:protein OCTOPUS-like n=1 Tax=Rutidosis leptorrhynchoides TaxID=125765 RepID=UPI003A98EC43
MSQDPQTRTRTRTRRESVCHRHPNESVTGLCALCLRDRLTYLDSSSSSSTGQIEVKHENIISFPLSRRTRGHAVPELRRCKSVAVEKCEVLNSDQRRKSCDVRVGNKLTDLFDLDDTKKLGFLSVTEPVLEMFEHNNDNNSIDHDDCNKIRVSNARDSEIRASIDAFVRNEVDDNDGEDLRTMKEHIEMELQNKKRNFWNAASVFGQKLRKWRQKNKRNDKSKLVKSEVVDYGLGRKSCDTAPRFSIDANRIDEHRASWDGYMIARTIPTLTPMLPIIDDIMLQQVNKGITVKEDLSSSSAKSNSDSSLLNTGSSSSSMKSLSSKTGDDGIGQETKLVITERELKDWHLRSVNANNVKSSHALAVKILNGNNKEIGSSWRKLWTNKKNGDYVQENNEVERRDLSGTFVRNSSYVGARELSHLRVEEGGRHSMSDIDSGLMRLRLPLLRTSKS